jgi:hypothetical protein
MPSIGALLRPLDRLLRGDWRMDQPEGAGAHEGALSGLRLRLFVPWALTLGALYGFFVGWFALFGGRTDALLHVLAVMLKVPLLFLCTLLVTFPSLYVFGALLGSRLSFSAMLRLLVATIVVNLTIAASLGPILGFFTLSTTSYGFMVLLNVALMGLAGLVSTGFLMRALVRLSSSQALRAYGEPVRAPEPGGAPMSATAAPWPPPIPRAPAPEPSGVPPIFIVWILTYGVVGAQMGWILRPFIGAPGAPFELFRARSGSVLSGLSGAVQSLFN